MVSELDAGNTGSGGRVYAITCLKVVILIRERLCSWLVQELIRFQAVSVRGVKISPFILYHFVILAPGNPRQQSQMNTNESCTENNMPYSQ